ncbi:MAG: exosome complex RNA-binding protein Csl4 [Thaumarchaeota archaeon]|nr:exosome complex RNA-binding protein Csl4 [Nitrososphaerota archaeon]
MALSQKPALPGDKIAIIEEFETGENTFDDGQSIRSLVVGTPEFDKTSRIARINEIHRPAVAKSGDVVTGSVAALMNNMFAINILYINGKPTHAGLECICQAKGAKKRILVRVGDVVTAKILSLLNGVIHATISEPELGVLFTQCIKCGAKVIAMGSNIKCIDCGYIEERKLSTRFGNSDFIKFNSN